MKPARSLLKPFLIFVALFFAVWSFRATVFYSFDAGIRSDAARHVYSNALKFAVWVLPTFIFLRCIDGKNPFKYLKFTSAIHKTNLLYAVVLILLYYSSIFFLSFFVMKNELSFNLSASAVVSTSISALFEEILFRGFVLNKLEESVSFWAANLITALLFVLVHYPNWLWTKGFHPQILTDSVSIFILACVLGYLVKKTNSLLPSVGAHIGNNLAASIFRA